MKFNLFWKGFKKGAKNFSGNISVIVNSFLLLIVYLVGVGLTSVIAKIVGKKFLETKIEKEKKSFWKEIKWSKKKEDYFRQF